MDWGTAGAERHLRIRARSAAGRVAGAANYKHGLAAQRARTACPYVFPERPLFRTDAPYARRLTPDQRNNTRASASFHTGYQRDRVHQLPAAQGIQDPRPIPHRRRRLQDPLPRRVRHRNPRQKPRRPPQEAKHPVPRLNHPRLDRRPQPIRDHLPRATTRPNLINPEPRLHN